MASTPSSQAPLSFRLPGDAEREAARDQEASAQARKHDERLRSYGPLTNVVFDDEGDETDEESSYVAWSDLFTRPRIFQYLQAGKVHRSRAVREASRFELFGDLLMVGVVHQLAEAAVEEVSGRSVARFVLTFGPAWAMWSDLRNFLNSSGVDDIPQRILVLAYFVLLMGYSVNSAAIELPGQEASTAETAARILAEEGAADGEEGRAGFSRPLVASVAFYLVSKLCRLGQLALWAYCLPDFRPALVVTMINILIPGLIYLGVIFAKDWQTVVILASVACGYENMSRMLIGVARSILAFGKPPKEAANNVEEPGDKEVAGDEGQVVKKEKTPLEVIRRRVTKVPALNIEHYAERQSAFTSIVLGEMVVQLLYVAGPGATGLSDTFGRACFGLITAYVVNWAYFTSSLSRRSVHALRRHWFTGLSFSLLHFPLSAALLLASAALAEIVVRDDVENGLRWYYGGGLSVATVCIGLLQLMNRSLEPVKRHRLVRPFRLSLRVGPIITFALLPLATSLSDLAFLGIYAAIACFTIALDVVGQVGKPKAAKCHPERQRSGTVDDGVGGVESME